MHGSQRPRPAQLPPPADTGVRIGDAERDRVIDQLADHHAAGRLTQDPGVRTYLAVMALLWLVWLVAWLTTGAAYPWPVWPMLGWGIGVFGHRSPR